MVSFAPASPVRRHIDDLRASGPTRDAPSMGRPMASAGAVDGTSRNDALSAVMITSSCETPDMVDALWLKPTVGLASALWRRSPSCVLHDADDRDAPRLCRRLPRQGLGKASAAVRSDKKRQRDAAGGFEPTSHCQMYHPESTSPPRLEAVSSCEAPLNMRRACWAVLDIEIEQYGSGGSKRSRDVEPKPPAPPVFALDALLNGLSGKS